MSLMGINTLQRIPGNVVLSWGDKNKGYISLSRLKVKGDRKASKGDSE